MTIIWTPCEQDRLSHVVIESQFQQALATAKDLARKHRGLSVVTIERPADGIFHVIVTGRLR